MNELFTFCFYNVENFFDYQKHHRKDQNDFLPHSPKNWNQKKYVQKTLNIAKVLSDIGFEETRKNPSIMGLCEVENKKVLSDLVEALPKTADYSFVHYESRDERGIDVALIFDRKVFHLTDSESITVTLYDENGKEDYSRDILYCAGEFLDYPIHLIVVHLPSKRDEEVNRKSRIKIAMRTRDLIDQIFKKDQKARIILMGDFNENPDNPLFHQKLFAQANPRDLLPYQLYNPFELLYYEKKYTTFHMDEGLLFDQMLFSRSLVQAQNAPSWLFSKIFNPFYLINSSRDHFGQPLRTYFGNRYLGGYSDHFPVYSVLKFKL